MRLIYSANSIHHAPRDSPPSEKEEVREQMKKVARDGIEPPTQGFSIRPSAVTY
jgi:hypothetical protein